MSVSEKNESKKKVIKFRVKDQWLSVEECIEKGLKVTVMENGEYKSVTSNDDVLKHLRLPNSEQTEIKEEHKVENNKSISRKEVEELLKNVNEELEVLYENIDTCNDTFVVYKEGQAYAYKLLLKLLSRK